MRQRGYKTRGCVECSWGLFDVLDISCAYRLELCRKMTPIVEIVYIPASEAYQKNPSLLNGVCKFTKEAGCLG